MANFFSSTQNAAIMRGTLRMIVKMPGSNNDDDNL